MKRTWIIISVFLLLLMPVSGYGAEDGNSTNQRYDAQLNSLKGKNNLLGTFSSSTSSL